MKIAIVPPLADSNEILSGRPKICLEILFVFRREPLKRTREWGGRGREGASERGSRPDVDNSVELFLLRHKGIKEQLIN